MIMYNTLMGVAAGVSLLLVPRLWARLQNRSMPWLWLGRHKVSAIGWGLTFGVLGFILTVLGGMMILTWPLSEAKPYINMPFGAPSFVLGILLLAASFFLIRSNDEDLLDKERVSAVLAPISRVIFWLGIILVVITFAIIRFDVVSSAPVMEPITGRLNDYPLIENLFFALVMYAPAAIGCLLFPKVVSGSPRAFTILYWSWTIAGLAFALFSAMNFYTHTGMLINIGSDGVQYNW